MLLLIDNEDSFTYNIASAFEALGQEVCVVSSKEPLPQADAVVIGPGPGHPKSVPLSRTYLESGVPILGICMGHQLIGSLFGGSVCPAKSVMHGKRSCIYHNGKGLFEELEQGFLAMRYHSLALGALPDCLEKTAWTECGEIMGVQHRTLPIYGVQFHPDSVGTPCGLALFARFLRLGCSDLFSPSRI